MARKKVIQEGLIHSLSSYGAELLDGQYSRLEVKKLWLSGISRGKYKSCQFINSLRSADKASRCPYESFVDVS